MKHSSLLVLMFALLSGCASLQGADACSIFSPSASRGTVSRIEAIYSRGPTHGAVLIGPGCHYRLMRVWGESEAVGPASQAFAHAIGSGGVDGWKAQYRIDATVVVTGDEGGAMLKLLQVWSFSLE